MATLLMTPVSQEIAVARNSPPCSPRVKRRSSPEMPGAGQSGFLTPCEVRATFAVARELWEARDTFCPPQIDTALAAWFRMLPLIAAAKRYPESRPMAPAALREFNGRASARNSRGGGLVRGGTHHGRSTRPESRASEGFPTGGLSDRNPEADKRLIRPRRNRTCPDRGQHPGENILTPEVLPTSRLVPAASARRRGYPYRPWPGWERASGRLTL
jgi:hypothetical protein